MVRRCISRRYKYKVTLGIRRKHRPSICRAANIFSVFTWDHCINNSRPDWIPRPYKRTSSRIISSNDTRGDIYTRVVEYAGTNHDLTTDHERRRGYAVLTWVD